MKFSIPNSFPSRKDFFNEIQSVIFPDVEAGSVNGYAAANEDAAKKLGMRDECILPNSKYARIIQTVSEYGYIFGKSYEAVYSDNTVVTINLETFCDPLNRSLRNWLTDTNNSKTTKAMDCAIFYTMLLLGSEHCKNSAVAFFKKCLAYIGITDLEFVDYVNLFRFDWDELEIKPGCEKKFHTWLANKPIKNLCLTLYTIFSLVGTGMDVVEEKLTIVHNIFKNNFAKECKIIDSVNAAGKALWSSIKYFEPRSIQTSNQEMYPQNFFVPPVFTKNNVTVDSPFAEIDSSNDSHRSMIVAKTGMGKSLLLQMAVLRMLNGKYDKYEASIDDINIKVPSDMHIVYVPAKMFTYCYMKDEYRRWTSDFITLYYNSMWRLSSKINFYSTNDSQRYGNANQQDFALNDEDLSLLKKGLSECARNGKLLLILDSFDEIPVGNMRDEYLKSLASFYDNYCEYPEHIGAHVVFASREMSPETMMSVKTRLKLPSNDDLCLYRIESLNSEQRRSLINNWDKFINMTPEEKEIMMHKIEINHCYREYAVNPYMLSVMCFYFKHSLSDISSRYIQFLVENMMRKNRGECDEIQHVLTNITVMLQKIANSTIVTGVPYFKKKHLEDYIINSLEEIDYFPDISDVEKRKMLEKIQEILVISVGLIVPADGKDDAYQFINDQIRYELAAKAIRDSLLGQNNATVYYKNGILPAIANTKDYVGVLVPILCDINLEDTDLAQVLILDLLMHRISESDCVKDEELLTTAMLDLLLNRYSSNIITCASPGEADVENVRQSQRMLLMRLFTSSAFEPTAEEKVEIKKSAAFTSNISYFSKAIINSLN